MELITYKDSRGAIRADSHYLELGHKIIATGEQKTNLRGDKVERLVRYKCTECEFESFSRELIKK